MWIWHGQIYRLRSCVELVIVTRRGRSDADGRRVPADGCCLFLFPCPSVPGTSAPAGSPVRISHMLYLHKFDFCGEPSTGCFFVGALLLFVCAQHHCDCCLLFLFSLLPAVWIQGWISYTTPTCISPINELWQTTFPFSVCDILNEQPFFDYFLTDLIWKRLFSFCSVLTSSAIPATATQSYRHFIFVVHFGKKFWHTKCSLERRKASWHASLISSTVLLRKRRRWESSHPRNLFPDWGKKMVNEYMTF